MKSLTDFSNLTSEYSELKNEFNQTSIGIDLIFGEIDRENSYRRSMIFGNIKRKSIEKYKNHMSYCVRITFFRLVDHS